MTETIDCGSSHVHLEVTDGIAVLRLDHGKVNALTEEMQDACGRAARLVGDRPDVAALVLLGNARAFAAGVDITELAASDEARMAQRVVVMHESYSRVAECPKPVVAGITGYALGGGFELALCADVRIAGEGATVGFPEIKLGLVPGAGGTQRLARLVGPSRTKDLVLTGRFVPAAEALAMGAVDRVVPDADVEQEAIAWARQFVGQASVALRAAKETIDRGLGVDLRTGLMLEQTAFAGLFGTEDARLGLESFQANGPGKARFVGR